MSESVLRTDYLVLGSGVAGLRAALVSPGPEACWS